MISFFSKLFNRELLDNQTKGAPTYAIGIVGSEARVKQLLALYRDNNMNRSLQLVMQKGLLDYATDELYTPGEMAAFKKGLVVVLEFLDRADAEDQVYEKSGKKPVDS